MCLFTQSCPTLCDPTDCSTSGCSVHGDSPGKNTGVGCHAPLQCIFPTHELNWSLLHCRQILYQLSYQRSSSTLSTTYTSKVKNVKKGRRGPSSESRSYNSLTKVYYSTTMLILFLPLFVI